MTELGITWETLLVIAGGIIVLVDAGKRLLAMTKPVTEMQEKQRKLEQKLASDKLRLDSLDRELKLLREYQEQSSAIIGLAVAELMNHIITGNDVEQLKKRENDLNTFFYKDKSRKVG